MQAEKAIDKTPAEKDSKFYTVALSDQNIEDWNKVAKNSDEVWVFHDLELSAILAKRRNAERKSFILYNNSNQPVAILPLYFYTDFWETYLLRNKRRLESYFTGPAIINGLNEKTRREILFFIGRELENICEELNADKCIVYSCALSKRHLETHFAYVNPLHEMRGGWANSTIAYLYLNLTPDEGELLKNMETRTRSILNKIEKEQKIKVRLATPADLEAARKLYIDAHKRTHFPFYPEDFEWFFNNKNSYNYIAEINNEPASVVNMMTHGNSGYYWSSYTATAFVDSEVNTYLLWCAFKEMKKLGVLHLDLGDQPFAAPGSKTDNIARFKRGYGSELRYRFRMQYNRQGKSQKFFNALHKAIVPPLTNIRIKISAKLSGKKP
jgi:hypothetical protein